MKLSVIFNKTYAELSYEEKDHLIKMFQKQKPDKYVELLEYFIKYPTYNLLQVTSYVLLDKDDPYNEQN